MEEIMLKDLVTKSRSYRRFIQDSPVSIETLSELVDLARLTPSGRNVQPLKYVLINDPTVTARVFPKLGWAGYLLDWKGPVEGERPPAYIFILLDKSISPTSGVDQGIAAQTILLGAAEKELGGCIVATIRKEELAKLLNLEYKYEILLVLAIGKPLEKVYLEELPESGNIKYWRDPEGGHHVPKRPLKDIILRIEVEPQE
jgi:nitroreductase